MSTAPVDSESGTNDAAHHAPAKVAIIGGGLAGLTAALRLIDLADESQRLVDVTLYEASDRLGGLIGTVREGGYLIERGADAFLSKPAIIGLCERLGLKEDLWPTDKRFRGALILRNGKPVPVPTGFDLMAPAKIWPVLTTPILSPFGKLRLLGELLVPVRRESDDESLAAFTRRRLGQEALERLVQPLVAGIYTADPEKLSLAATLPRFIEMEQTQGSLIRAALSKGSREPAGDASGARYHLFSGPREGMEQFFSALREAVAKGATIRTATRVKSVRRDDSGWTVETETPGSPSEAFDAVIVTTPAYVASRLLNELDPVLANDLGRIPYASSAIVVTGHRLDEIANPLEAFGLVIPAIERRDVLAVSIASRKFPGRAPEGHVLLRTFIGGATRPEMLDRTDDELVSLARTELASMLGVSGRPDVVLVSRHLNAMPQYHVGHLDLVAKIEAATARHAGLALAGSGYRGVGMPDVVADAQQAAGAVYAALRKSD